VCRALPEFGAISSKDRIAFYFSRDDSGGLEPGTRAADPRFFMSVAIGPSTIVDLFEAGVFSDLPREAD